MGQCQSVDGPATTGSGVRVKSHHTPNVKQAKRAFVGRVKFARKPKLSVVAAGRNAPMSPSEHTAATQPVSPDSLPTPMSSLGNLTPDPRLDDDEEEEEEDGDDPESQGVSLLSFVPSLRHTEELSAVIPEEVDPDAPSDEEEQHQSHAEALRRSKKAWESEPGPLNPLGVKTDSRRTTGSPPRPKRKGLRMRSRYRRQSKGPNSIVYHDEPPLVAPPPGQELPLSDGPPSPGSVERHTIAHFNKVRVQAQMAAQQQRKKRRTSKLGDRQADVQEYRKLWKNFEDMKHTASSSAPATPVRGGKLKRQRSFDLKNTTTWFFDFQAIAFEGDDDDAKSQSSRLSLLSDKDREAQRRIFEEKSRHRRSNSEPCLTTLLTNLGSPEKHQDAEASPDRQSLREEITIPGTVVSVRRRKSEYGQEDQSLGVDSSRPRTPENASVAVTHPTWDYTAERNDYGIKKSLELVDPNSLTPKRRTYADEPSVSSLVDMGADNDYQVPRRRRQVSRDFSESLTLQEKMDAELLGIVLHPSPTSDYNLDDVSTTSSLSEIAVLQLPSSDTMVTQNVEPTLWRTLSERVAMGNADRCLRDVRAKPSAVEDRNTDCSNSPVKHDISKMSTVEFLRIADGHAHVKGACVTNHSQSSSVDEVVGMTEMLDTGNNEEVGEKAMDRFVKKADDITLLVEPQPDVKQQTEGKGEQGFSAIDVAIEASFEDEGPDQMSTDEPLDDLDDNPADDASGEDESVFHPQNVSDLGVSVPPGTEAPHFEANDQKITHDDAPDRTAVLDKEDGVADMVLGRVKEVLSSFRNDRASMDVLHGNYDVPEDEIAADHGVSTPVACLTFNRAQISVTMDDAPLDELASLVRAPTQKK